MTAALILLAFAIVSALIATRNRRHKPDGRDCAPLTRHEREDAWRESFRAEMSLEAYLCTAFRGAAAKKRLLAHQRNRASHPGALPPYRATTVRAVEHFGIGPRVLRTLAVPEALKSIQTAPAPVQIIVKRPRAVLTLAR